MKSKEYDLFTGCGYIDKTGKIAIPFEYENAKSFKGGVALVFGISSTYRLLVGQIDKKGNLVNGWLDFSIYESRGYRF